MLSLLPFSYDPPRLRPGSCLCTGKGWGCPDPSSSLSAMSGPRAISIGFSWSRICCTFLASFFCLRCFAAEAFSILLRRRTGTRLDFGSVVAVSILQARSRYGRLTSDLHCGMRLLCVLSSSSMKFRNRYKKFDRVQGTCPTCPPLRDLTPPIRITMKGQHSFDTRDGLVVRST